MTLLNATTIKVFSLEVTTPLPWQILRLHLVIAQLEERVKYQWCHWAEGLLSLPRPANKVRLQRGLLLRLGHQQRRERKARYLLRKKWLGTPQHNVHDCVILNFEYFVSVIKTNGKNSMKRNTITSALRYQLVSLGKSQHILS